jgi:hypothetical protein
MIGARTQGSYNGQLERLMQAEHWDRLSRDRLHVAPRAVELASAAARRCYRHIWAPIDDLLSRLAPLPSGLIRLWLGCPGGHIVLTHLPSRYEPGEKTLKRNPLRNVALVCVSDLAEPPLEALVPVGHLLDHLLGCGGEEHGTWLSEGGGCGPALRDVGQRILSLFSLGYGFDAAACQDPRDYFARSLALYLLDRCGLSVADPQMERLLRSSLLSEAFWALAARA